MVEEQGFLRLPKVLELVGFKKTKIYLMMKKGEFPQCIKLGARTSVWRAGEVLKWIESQGEKSNA